MKPYVQQRIRRLESWLAMPIGEPDAQAIRLYCQGIVNEIRRHAVKTGHPAVIEICQRRGGGLQFTQRLLADCVAALNQNAETYSPPEIAKQHGVKPSTVVGWIKSGQLKAANLSKGVRPRFRVRKEDLAEFMQRQQPQPRAKSIRRTRKASRF